MTLRLFCLAAPLLAISCGEVASDTAPDGGAPDALPDAAAEVRCDGTAPFAPPVEVFPDDTTGTVRLASLSHDGLSAYLARAEGAAIDEDVYVSTRATLQAPWGAPTMIPQLSSDDSDLRVAVSADGLWAVINRLPVVVTKPPRARGLYLAWRPQPSALFQTPSPLDTINTSMGQTDPYLSPDGLDLYFGRVVDGAARLFRSSRRTVNGRFEPPVEVPGVGPSTSAWLAPDRVTLYFHSDRPETLGSVDLWRTTRGDPDAAFGDPEHLAALSSPKVDFLTGVTGDDCELYFTSDRSGAYKLYRAARPAR